MITNLQRGLCVAAVLLCCAAAACADDYTHLQAKAVAYAKQIPVAQLDPGLPKVALATWLSQSFPRARINWELNDCGEGGDRDPAGVPYCVEAQIHHPDGRIASVAVAIGDYPHLIHGKPSIFWVTVKRGDHYEQVHGLAKLPSALR